MKVNARVYYIIIGVILSVMLFAGCEDPVRESSETLSIELAIPASDMFSACQAPNMRAMGDPGSEEVFALPEYAYIFVILKDNDSPAPTISYLHYDGNSKLDKTKWVKVNDPNGDSYLYYSERIRIVVPKIAKREFATIYMAVSDVELTLSSTTPVTEEDVKAISFTTTTASDIQTHAQNIYSSPYNYPSEATYYGKVTNYTSVNVPIKHLTLYHVAAKVDLMWNVAEGKRENVKLSYISAENLYNGECYLFKPAENTIGNFATYKDAGYAGYSKVLVESLSPGTQWNGRAYFYTIPYKNNTGKYPLQIKLQKDGGTPVDGYYLKLVETTVPEIWTSWIRGQITISSDLDYNKPD